MLKNVDIRHTANINVPLGKSHSARNDCGIENASYKQSIYSALFCVIPSGNWLFQGCILYAAGIFLV